MKRHLGGYVAHVQKSLMGLLLIMGLGVFLQGSAAVADVNVLIIGSTTDFGSELVGTGQGTYSDPFTPTEVKAELQQILEGAGLGTVNVTMIDRSEAGGAERQWVISAGEVVANTNGLVGSPVTTTLGWFYYPYPEDVETTTRWPNLRGELGTKWDYIILIGDPYVMENTPGVYAQAVGALAEEVAKAPAADRAELVLFMPWPAPVSTSTVDHYNKIVYRVGRSGAIKVVPAALAWQAAGSPTNATMHPSNDGAYIAAASIYSRLWNQSASTSTYNPHSALADLVHQTVVNAEPDTGSYEATFLFNMLHKKRRDLGIWDLGTSTEQGFFDGCVRAIIRSRMISTADKGYCGLEFSRDESYYDGSAQDFHCGFSFAGTRRGPVPSVGNMTPDNLKIANDYNLAYIEQGFNGFLGYLLDPSKWFYGAPKEKFRFAPSEIAWAAIVKEFPSLLPRKAINDEHQSLEAEDALGTFGFTLFSGRCSVDPQPDPITSRWVAQKVGYETAWRLANCVSRAPGFKVMPSAADKLTITHDAPETLTVQFINPPQTNVTVNVLLSNESAALVAPRTLTFTPQNYNVAQEVVVTPLRGSTATDVVNVEFATVSDDEVYSGLADSWDYTVQRVVEAITQVDNGITSAQTLQNTPVTIDLNAAGANTNSTELLGPLHGSMEWTGAGVIQYTPDTDYIGDDWIAYASTVNGTLTKGYVAISVVAPAGQVLVSVADGFASEQGPNPGSFSVSRLGSTAGAINLYFTMGGSATAGVDYTINATSPVTIPDGQSSVTVTVTPIDDGDVEGPETVTLSLTENAGYEIGVVAATLTIADNDSPEIITSPWVDVDPILDSGTASLHVVASHAGGAPLTYTWSRVSGYGAVDFSPNGTESSSNTTASFSSQGFYVLKVTVSDGTTSVSDNVSITVLHDVSNLLSAVVYEPFDLPAATNLLGQPVTGFGLSGGWSYGVNPTFDVSDGGLSYGGLSVAGDLHTSYRTRRSGAGASLDSGLSDAGLLDDGGTLWFSVLHRIAPGNHAEASGSFALSSGNLSYGVPPGTANGVGFWIGQGDMLHAAVWTNLISTNTVVDLAPTGTEFGDTVLIVGKVSWGADASANDTVELYLPDTNMNIGAVVSTASAPIDQATIAVVAFGGTLNNANECQDFDEIRVGGSYESVGGQSITTYTVTYNGNGNTGGTVPSAQSKTQGVDVILASNSGNLVKDGLTFAGWNTAVDGTGTDYAEGATYSTDANLTLYAKWSTVPVYALTVNNGSGSGNYAQGASVGIAATIAAGYHFVSWTGDTAYVTDVNSASTTVTMPAAAVSVTANTAVNTYTVTFDLAGKGTSSDTLVQTVTHGSAATAPTVAANAGYTFTGWDVAFDNITSSLTVTAQYNAHPVAAAGPDQSITMDGSAAWSPADIATVAWYDASDASTIHTNDAVDSVSQWDDKSGNTNHLVQSNSTKQPLSNSRTMGALNVLYFDGADWLEDASFAVNTESLSVFMVRKRDTLVYATREMGIRRSTVAEGAIEFDKDSLGYRYPVGGTISAASAGVRVTNDMVITYIADGTANQKLWANGALGGSNTNGITPFTSQAISIGGTPYTSGMNGVVAEVVVVDSVLSTEDRQKIEGYLAHKWGLQANLPADHLYKDAAPGGSGAVATLAGTVTDPDGTTPTATWSVASTDPAGLPVTFGNASSATTTASFAQVGLYTLRLTADDGIDTAFDEVVVTVTNGTGPVNTAPVANAQSVTTAEDAAKAITLAGSDADGDTLTYAIVTQPAHGTLSGTGASRTYTPAANYNGADSFTFKVNDGTVDSAAATVSITVTSVNDLPAVALTGPANGSTYTAPATITLTATAWDIDGTITKVEFFNGASLIGTDTSSPYSFTWSNVSAGSYTLSAKATDNQGGLKASASVNVTVSAPVNNAPVANAQSVTTAEDTAKAITLTGSDADGDTLSYAIVTQPAHGTLSGTAPNVTYTPAANYNGSDSFTFKVNDGTVDSAAATVLITVTSVNDLPVASAGVDQTLTDTDGNGSESVTLNGSGSSDVEGAIASYVWKEGASQIATGVNPTVILPVGVHTITLTVTDNGGATATDTVLITVEAVSSLPSPWMSQDVGVVGLTGSASFSNGVFTVKGAGTGVDGTADSLHFVSQIASGDCDIKVRVASLADAGTAGQAGVMICETLEANAREAGVWVTPGGIAFTYRKTTDGKTTISTATGAAPVWVRMVRSGKTFSGYYSDNGTTWTQVGSSATINMVNNLYMGLGVSSGMTDSLATGTMDNVTAAP